MGDFSAGLGLNSPLAQTPDTTVFRVVTTLISIRPMSDPIEELRRLYPPILTTAHVAEMMHSTIGDVRDKVHAKKLPAMRWGQQFRFFRDEVLEAMQRVGDVDTDDQRDDEAPEAADA